MDLIDRIMSHVSVEDRGYKTACWVWTGNTRDGYGLVRIGSRTDGTRRMRNVHIVMYDATKGPIPTGLDHDHLCRVRACCNPDHIEPVTHAENVRRGSSPAKLRERFAAMTHCSAGHAFNEQNTYLYVNKRGHTKRTCRVCKNERRRKHGSD